MSVKLGQRTEETVAVYFERAQSAVIRAVLPQRARTLEEALADGQYVGDVWCYAMDPSGDPQAMVSYCVFEQALWGRGVASEALGLFLEEIRERFGLERIGAFTFTANQGSVRVLEKNGFRLAETLVEDGTASGYYTKSIVSQD